MVVGCGMNKTLVGDGSFPFTVIVDGDDLVVKNARATAWGGPTDKYDDGTTAAGVNTKQWGGVILGCSLPQNHSGEPNTEGSPIPRLRYGRVLPNGKPDLTDPNWVQVKVYFHKTGKEVMTTLLDNGPAKPPKANAAIDLTTGTIKQGGYTCNPNAFDGQVDFRIIGGAHFL
jgi:hypothetical protein